MGVSQGSDRLLLRLGAGAAGLVVLAGSAAAHGPHGSEGEPVAFAVVVGLPVVVGLGGGAIALRRARPDGATLAGHRTGVVLGVLLAVLGVTFAASAVTTSRPLGAGGGAVGALATLWATRGDGAGRRQCHADLALGAVSAHRLLEGVALGALYSAGATIGALGAALVAGHTAFETAAVGGVYATSHGRIRAIVAIVLVQAGYVAGAVVGLGVAGALPTSARALALAVAGGALLVVGAGETERSIAARRPATA